MKLVCCHNHDNNPAVEYGNCYIRFKTNEWEEEILEKCCWLCMKELIFRFLFCELIVVDSRYIVDNHIQIYPFLLFNFLFEIIFWFIDNIWFFKCSADDVLGFFGVYVYQRAVLLQLTKLDCNVDLFFEQYNGEKTNE